MAPMASLLISALLWTPAFSQWGAVTETGVTCVECEYQGETFSTCGKWGAKYVWCCTAAPYSNSNWEKCDETEVAEATTVDASTYTCSDFSVVWGIAQVAGGGCATEGKFFDMKGLDNSVSAATDPAVLNACCTPWEDALCRDWQAIHGLCSSGNFWPNDEASSDGTLDKPGYDAACCKETAPDLTCSDFSVVWGLAQVGGGGCKEEGKFFDMKTLGNSVSAYTDAAVMESCCTPFQDALCSDWAINFGDCSSGNFWANAKASSDGNLLKAGYETACCKNTQPALTCSDFSVGWLIAQGLGQGCHTEAKFFDTKKKSTSVSSSEDADIRTACCTLYSEAKCGDWPINCDAGSYEQAGDARSGTGEESKTPPTQSEFQDTCCSSSASCANFQTTWIFAQVGGLGCGTIDQFFDVKKRDNSVESPEQDSSIIDACCTRFADALCSDWKSIMGTCRAGVFTGANSAPNTSSKSLSDISYETRCCISLHSITWGIVADVDKTDYEARPDEYSLVFRRAGAALAQVNILQVAVAMTFNSRRLEGRRLADLSVLYTIKVNDAAGATAMSTKLGEKTKENVNSAITSAKNGLTLTMTVSSVEKPTAVESAPTGGNDKDVDSAMYAGPLRYLAMISLPIFAALN